jgi:hypothetical protein
MADKRFLSSSRLSRSLYAPIPWKYKIIDNNPDISAADDALDVMCLRCTMKDAF